MWRLAFGLALTACICLAGCNSGGSTTDLNPEGPPMVRQVFMKERIEVGGTDRIRDGLAFGDHPQREDLPQGDSDDGTVARAVALGNQRIRVVLDELVRGNAIEVIACADGTFSDVPVGADPDDIADCAGPPDAIVDSCTAVCICEDESAPCASDPNVGLGQPIGILDENEDGAADDFRMKQYGDDELAALVNCDGTNIPLDPEQSFFNPSGNQLIPAGPIGINGLGPALVLVPDNGLRPGAKCGITFQPEVVDKDGNQICAPENGDISFDCTPGDTELISWNVEPLTLRSSDPEDGDTDVRPIQAAGEVETMLLQFNAAIDMATVEAAISLTDGAGDVPISTTVSADDPTIVQVETVDPCCASGSSFTLDVTSALTDIFEGALPQDEAIAFDVLPLSLASSDPPECEIEVPLTDDGSADKTLLLSFNAAIDEATAINSVTLSDGNGEVASTVAVSADDPTVVTVTVTGGLTADTIYTVDVADTLADILGGTLPAAVQYSFSTGTTAPNGCN